MRVIDRGGLPVRRLENCPNKRVPRDKRVLGTAQRRVTAAPPHCKHYFRRGRTGFLADIIIAIAPSTRLILMCVCVCVIS